MALSRPTIGFGTCQISPRGKELVMQALTNNRLSAGPMVSKFEAEIARLHGRRFGLFCNSGTSALHLALAALKEREGWQDGDEVLVPAVTFVASSNVILHNGLRPVFVDVEPDYYCIDPSKIEARITPRTRAIMPVHIAGLPSDMTVIEEIARRRGLHLVEDSAEAMFVHCQGRPVGSFSTISCFSTYVAHIINTGVGGLCLSNDPEYHSMVRSLANHGRDSIYIRLEDDDDLEAERFHEVISKRFSFVRLGHSFRATEMEAALGLAEVERYPESKARREEIAAAFTAGLSSLQEYLQLPAIRPGCEHSWMFYPIVVRDGVSRRDFVEFLEEHGIETRFLLPLINQPVYRQMFGDLDSEFPEAARLNAAAFAIGSHPGITNEDISHILDSCHRFFRSRV